MSGEKWDYDVLEISKHGHGHRYTKVGTAVNIVEGGIKVRLQSLPFNGELLLLPAETLPEDNGEFTLFEHASE